MILSCLVVGLSLAITSLLYILAGKLGSIKWPFFILGVILFYTLMVTGSFQKEAWMSLGITGIIGAIFYFKNKE